MGFGPEGEEDLTMFVCCLCGVGSSLFLRLQVTAFRIFETRLFDE